MFITGCTPAGTAFTTPAAASSTAGAATTSDAGPTTVLTTAVPTTVEPTTAATTTLPAPVKPLVGIAQGTDYAEVTMTAIANAGGLAGVITAGDTVLIKPNLCWDIYVDSPITTDYRVVAEIVSEVAALGAGRIIIAEGPFGPECFTDANLAKSRYDTIDGVEFLSFNALSEDECYYRMGEKSVTGQAMYIPMVYVDADVVITVPKMKTHNSSMVTLGLKNAFGVPPRGIYGSGSATSGAKERLHNDFDFNAAIVEINLIRKPDFIVIDGIVAGEGEGPIANTALAAQTIIAGRDIVAVDTVAATFMGFDPAGIPHLALAVTAGLGEGDLSRIEVVGASLSDIVIDFQSIYPKG